MDSSVHSKRAEEQAAKSTGTRPASRRPALTEELCVGALIGGKYAAQRVIGKGAMGLVLAARHTALDVDVAIKFIKPEMRDAPDVVSRFAREAKASALIKSEHIANIIDVGICDNLGPYIVMEYLSGRDLAQVLHAKKRLGIPEVVDYAMQVCEGLALAHSLGIVHRDIKPSNLFVTRRGELEVIKILDFGISKVALTGRVFGDDLSVMETSHMMGTPLYMSPEQIRSTCDVDHRADIWSLGVVMRELITGKKTFIAKGAMQICALVLDGDPPPLERDAPEAPPGLCAVVRRCLDKNVDQRYQDVAELARALMPYAPQRSGIHAIRASSVLGNPDADSAFALDPHAVPGLRAGGVLPSFRDPVARASRPAPPKPTLAKPKPELPSGSDSAPTSVYDRTSDNAPAPPPRLGVPPGGSTPRVNPASLAPQGASNLSQPPSVHQVNLALGAAPSVNGAAATPSMPSTLTPGATLAGAQHVGSPGQPRAPQAVQGRTAHPGVPSGQPHALPPVLVTTPPSSIPGRRAPSEPASLVLTSPARARIKPTAVRVRAIVGAALSACAIYGFVIYAYQRNAKLETDTMTAASATLARQTTAGNDVTGHAPEGLNASLTNSAEPNKAETGTPPLADESTPKDSAGSAGDGEASVRHGRPSEGGPRRGAGPGRSSPPSTNRDVVADPRPVIAPEPPRSVRTSPDDPTREPKNRARLVDEPNRVELLQ